MCFDSGQGSAAALVIAEEESRKNDRAPEPMPAEYGLEGQGSPLKRGGEKVVVDDGGEGEQSKCRCCGAEDYGEQRFHEYCCRACKHLAMQKAGDEAQALWQRGAEAAREELFRSAMREVKRGEGRGGGGG
jgi:hypothetical protein